MAKLQLDVNVDTKGTNKLDSIGGKIASVGKVAVIGAAAVGSAVGIAGAAFTAMASEAEQAQAKLDSVFKSTGASAWTSVDALNAHATAMAEATTFDDDAIKGAQAALIQFGNITGEQFTQATEGAADLAAFMGTDVTQAAKQLGVALADPESGITRLRRAGIILSEQQQQQIRDFTAAGDVAAAQGVILDALGQKMGTVAEDLAATSGGQMTQALNQLGEVGEALGVFLLPVLTAVAQALSGLAAWVQANMPAIKAAIQPVIVAVSQAFNWLAANVLPKLVAAFQAVVGWVVENWPAISSVAGQVFGAIANAVKVVWPIIERVGSVLFPAVAVAAGVLFKALDIAFKGIGGAFEVLGNIFDTVGDVIKNVFSGVVGFVKGLWNAFVGFWNGIEISVPSVDIPFVGRVGGFAIGLPDLPYLAQGGIVTEPTLAVLGEKGPEAVVPLGQGGMGEYHTHIHVDYYGEPPDSEDSLVDLLEQVAPFIDGRLAVSTP